MPLSAAFRVVDATTAVQRLGHRPRKTPHQVVPFSWRKGGPYQVAQTPQSGPYQLAHDTGLNRAVEACRRLDLQPIDSHIIDRARRLQPTGLRSLDAVHLASALEPKVAPMLVAYDNRLLQAASDHQLVVASPGA